MNKFWFLDILWLSKESVLKCKNGNRKRKKTISEPMIWTEIIERIL